MSELEDYDVRCGRIPLTLEQVCAHVAAARRRLVRADEVEAVDPIEDARVLVWLGDLAAAVGVWVSLVAKHHDATRRLVESERGSVEWSARVEQLTESRAERLRAELAVIAQIRKGGS